MTDFITKYWEFFAGMLVALIILIPSVLVPRSKFLSFRTYKVRQILDDRTKNRLKPVVVFDDAPPAANPWVTELTLCNSGMREIAASDFEDDVRIIVSGAPIIAVFKKELDSVARTGTIEDEGKSVRLTARTLNSREKSRIILITEGRPRSTRVTARIIGQTRARVTDISLIQQISVVAAVFICILMGSIGSAFSSKNPSDAAGYASAIAEGIGAVLGPTFVFATICCLLYVCFEYVFPAIDRTVRQLRRKV